MPTDRKRSIPSLVIGLMLIAIGVAVFGIRLIHPGPYAMPGGGALAGGLGAIALGGLLLWLGRLRPWGWLLVIASPAAVFPALYSVMGESAEVISLYAPGADGTVTDLRLWIVDRQDGAWVGMSREKALAHRLDGQRLSMLRSGKLDCVVPVLHEDRATVGAIHRMKVAKYAVAQLAGAIGLYPLEATDSTVALRLDRCPPAGP